jgi:hypothetical protein
VHRRHYLADKEPKRLALICLNLAKTALTYRQAGGHSIPVRESAARLKPRRARCATCREPLQKAGSSAGGLAITAQLSIGQQKSPIERSLTLAPDDTSVCSRQRCRAVLDTGMEILIAIELIVTAIFVLSAWRKNTELMLSRRFSLRPLNPYEDEEGDDARRSRH